MSRNYCQAAASVVSALTIVAAQNRQSVTFKSAASLHKLVTTSSDPSCRCRIRSCDMFGGKQRASHAGLDHCRDAVLDPALCVRALQRAISGTAGSLENPV